MKIDVITIFPAYFEPLKLSLIGKALDKGIVEIAIHDLRDHATGGHKSVDDTPYGGGAGMVMSPEPWGLAIDEVLEIGETKSSLTELIILTPAGQKLTQNLAQELSGAEHLIFACGRYEGIDQRVTDYYATQPGVRVRELSIGDYVLNGGEVATLVTLEAVIRLIPGVLGNPDSLAEESHSISAGETGEAALLEYPNYTKPAQWRGLEVPEVLLSGNHALIKSWRSERAQDRTQKQSGQTRE
jgi:tRNA (guanine37-N1)-methyltransferase